VTTTAATGRREDQTTDRSTRPVVPMMAGSQQTPLTRRRHMRFRYRRKTLIAIVAMAAVMALPGIALAGDSGGEATEEETTEEDTTTTTTPQHQVNQVVQTLPVLATGLAVTIDRDETGAISVVGLDDATVIKEKDHKIAFLLSDGSTEVVFKAKAGFIQTKVKAQATAEVTGPGSWSADVFGNGIVTIPYEVTFEGNTPQIAIGAVEGPAGVTSEVGDPKVRTSEDGDKSSFKVKVKLTSGEDTAKVSFVAKVRVNDEGEVKVALSVSLSSRDRVHCWDDDDRHDGKWDRDDDDDERADRVRGDDDGRQRGDDDERDGDDPDDDDRGGDDDRGDEDRGDDGGGDGGGDDD
jgi:hypothetical protein